MPNDHILAHLELFKGRHFDQEIIVVCVRWYLSFKVSCRDLVQMMTERGIALAHTTILRWVQRSVPEFEKRWNRYARPVNGSWRCDETYIKVKGRWTYLYRAVDKYEQTVDFLLSERRDVVVAKRFFRKAIRDSGPPRSSDYFGRVCGFASSRPRIEIRGQPPAPCAAPIQ
jgi:transposase-like protein